MARPHKAPPLKCPCCWQPLAQSITAKLPLHFGPVQQRFFNLVRDYPNQMTRKSLYERIYGNMTRGDHTDESIFSVMAFQMNRKLKPLGLKLKSSGGPGAVWRVDTL